MSPYDAVLLSGTVGAGTTTTAEALSDLERSAGRPHAVVDLDQVRLLHPPPAGDPFQHAVELANLRDLARTTARPGPDGSCSPASSRIRARCRATARRSGWTGCWSCC